MIDHRVLVIRDHNGFEQAADSLPAKIRRQDRIETGQECAIERIDSARYLLKRTTHWRNAKKDCPKTETRQVQPSTSKTISCCAERFDFGSLTVTLSSYTPGFRSRLI